MTAVISLVFLLFGCLLVYSNAQCFRHNNNNNHLRYVPIPYNSNSKNPAAALTAALLSARALNGEQGLDGLRTLQTIQALQAQARLSPSLPARYPGQIPARLSPQIPARVQSPRLI